MAKYLGVNGQGIAHWSKKRSASNCCTYIDRNELLLKRTTEEHNRLSYLDLQITIDNGKYITILYDIVNLDSNIPVRSAYGVYTSQPVRIGRICVHFTSFVD